MYLHIFGIIIFDNSDNQIALLEHCFAASWCWRIVVTLVRIHGIKSTVGYHEHAEHDINISRNHIEAESGSRRRVNHSSLHLHLSELRGQRNHEKQYKSPSTRF